MKTVVLLLILTVSVSVSIAAGHWKTAVIAGLEKDKIRIHVMRVPLPVDLVGREVDSGLPNNIVYLLSLRSNEQIIVERKIQYTVTYDLWEEDYYLTDNADCNEGYRIYKRKDELMDKLSSLDICDINPGTAKDGYILMIQTVFNPIKEDRIKEIQAWVSGGELETQARRGPVDTSSRSQSVILDTAAGRQRSRGPRFRKLFDKILEQYAENSDPVGQWRSEVVTVNFKLPEITDEE